MDTLGNRLNSIANLARNALFSQGELAQLTYGAFDITAQKLNESEEEEIEITVPVGYRPDRTTIDYRQKLTKPDLLARYQYLAYHQLAVNGIVQLVTIIEAMLHDIVRALILKYPQKAGSKRSIPMQMILESHSLEEIHLSAADALLNEMSYKSPREFAEFFSSVANVNLLECPEFHRYVEVKASRDIFIHNRGIVNKTYLRKAGSHARAQRGASLPAETQYFLESYESCIRLSEWLEQRLHENWHSADYDSRSQPNAPPAEPEEGSE